MKQFSLTPKNSALSRVAETMGYSTELLHATGRAKLSIASVYHHLIHPLRLGQVCFAFCDRTGAPRAYITYALCTPQVATQLKNGREVSSLRLDEWNEGTICWITDVVAPYSDSLRSILFILRNNPVFQGNLKSIRVKGNHIKHTDIRNNHNKEQKSLLQGS